MCVYVCVCSYECRGTTPGATNGRWHSKGKLKSGAKAKKHSTTRGLRTMWSFEEKRRVGRPLVSITHLCCGAKCVPAYRDGAMFCHTGWQSL